MKRNTASGRADLGVVWILNQVQHDNKEYHFSWIPGRVGDDIDVAFGWIAAPYGLAMTG